MTATSSLFVAVVGRIGKTVEDVLSGRIIYVFIIELTVYIVGDRGFHLGT
jgi:hypothetical protein